MRSYRTAMSPRVALWIALLLSCQGGEPPGEPSMPDSPWTLADAVPRTDDGIRVLIIHDMEGLSGQSDPSSYLFGSELYPSGQEWLAADINAVVDGLFAGGATEVVIADGHGSGNPEPDVRRDLLDERATQIVRPEPFDTYFDLPESEDIDAVAVVGMHAKTGSGGFASHTITLGIDVIINGQAITETELVALSWGRVDVPVIFASGDDRLASDLETMPWIEFVTVKRATAADSAITRPVAEARADLRAGAQRAVEQLAAAKVMKVATPIHASLRAVPPSNLQFLRGVPGINYEDQTVTFVVNDLRGAYTGLRSTIGLATLGWLELWPEVASARPDAQELIDGFFEAAFQRWFDVESNRYEPAESNAPWWEAGGDATGPSGPPRFHGFR